MTDEFLADMEKWTLEYGSPRLQKAYAAGLLPVSKGIYRSERLALERPGWRYFNDGEPFKIRGIVNPAEEALDALLDARAEWPSVELVWLQPEDEPGEPWLTDYFLDRKIGIAVADVFKDENQ